MGTGGETNGAKGEPPRKEQRKEDRFTWRYTWPARNSATSPTVVVVFVLRKYLHACTALFAEGSAYELESPVLPSTPRDRPNTVERASTWSSLSINFKLALLGPRFSYILLNEKFQLTQLCQKKRSYSNPLDLVLKSEASILLVASWFLLKMISRHVADGKRGGYIFLENCENSFCD